MNIKLNTTLFFLILVIPLFAQECNCAEQLEKTVQQVEQHFQSNKVFKENQNVMILNSFRAFALRKHSSEDCHALLHDFIIIFNDESLREMFEERF